MILMEYLGGTVDTVFGCEEVPVKQQCFGGDGESTFVLGEIGENLAGKSFNKQRWFPPRLLSGPSSPS